MAYVSFGSSDLLCSKVDGSSPTQSGSRQKVDGRIAMSASLVIQSLGDPELELGALKSCETMSMMSALVMVRCHVASASVT